MGSRDMTRMLVTRPEPDAQTTVSKLAALDIEAVAAPLMVRRTLPVSLPPPAGFQAIVFTSANGIRSLADRGVIEQYLHLPVFAVGDRTAREAEAAGFQRVSSAAGALQDLVNAISLSGVRGPLFHATGKHQSGDLAQALAPSGVMVVTAKLYDMVAEPSLPPEILTALGDDIGAVLLYSRRTAEIFVELTRGLAPERRRRLGLLCLAEQVAEPLLEARYSRINLADRPDEDAMMALALAFAREQTGP